MGRRTVKAVIASAAGLAVASAALVAAPAASATTVTFSYTGAVQYFDVPAGVIELQIDAEGGDGGPSSNGGTYVDGVKGAAVSTVLTVTPGERLEVYVGGAGQAWDGVNATDGGWNGGGDGGNGASSGGGASDVRQGGSSLGDRVVVAGGGGGGRDSSAPGGEGGTPNGGDGTGLDAGGGCTVTEGDGATSSAPGSGGRIVGTCIAGFVDGSSGSLGEGGDATADYVPGGGGGFYGGGSGAGDSGTGTGSGAGGGSSYVPGDPSASVTTYAVKSVSSSTNGSVTITYTVLPDQTVTFDANGGSGSMPDQVTNTPTALTANSFTRSGYSFAGWNTAAGGSGTSYADGATFAFSASTTLYAQWTADAPPLPGPAPAPAATSTPAPTPTPTNSTSSSPVADPSETALPPANPSSPITVVRGIRLDSDETAQTATLRVMRNSAAPLLRDAPRVSATAGTPVRLTVPRVEPGETVTVRIKQRGSDYETLGVVEADPGGSLALPVFTPTRRGTYVIALIGSSSLVSYIKVIAR